MVMFEDAMIESAGTVASRPRWLSLAAFVLNGSILGLVILWPLLHPAALPRQDLATLLVAPAPPHTITRIAPRTVPLLSSRAESMQRALLAPSKIPRTIAMLHEAPAPGPDGIVGMGSLGSGSPSGIPDGILTGTTPAPVARVPVAKKVVISSGVMAGNRLSGAAPQYPTIAKSARIQGAVVLAASISKTGSIENLRVVSGPPMLQSAALDAVRTWRYKPYLLNGEPVAVDTTVTVIFHLGDG
jgi:protein TonB